VQIEGTLLVNPDAVCVTVREQPTTSVISSERKEQSD